MYINFSVSRKAFREHFFEQKPLLTRGAFNPTDYDWSLIDRALDLQDPTRELLKVLHRGRIDPSTYVEEYVDVGLRRRRILKDRLYRHLIEGATLVLNRIELVSPLVRSVCMDVGRFVGAQTTANAYASFGKEPATNVHWDTHDVFVVQTAGRKRWRLYEPTHPLPLSSQVSNDRKDEMPSQPVIDEIVAAGDVLYVPRGWWHRVEPVEDSETIHLTVAVHTPLILDYLVWACASVFPDFQEMRYSLLGEDHDKQRVADAATAAATALQDPTKLQAFYVRSQQRERVISPFDIQTLICQTDLPLNDNIKIILNARHPDASSTDFLINGQKIDLSGQHLKVVQALAATTSIDVRSLRARIADVPPVMTDRLLRDLARIDVVSLMEAPSRAKSSTPVE